MATLRRLVNAPGLGLHVLAGGQALDRTVSWVAVSELADPTPHLEGAELLLTTGVGRVFDPTSAGAYVRRLVDAGVSGLGFGVGISHELVPETLVRAADQAGLPLVEVDRPTPFIAVGKELADLLAAERGERARRELAGMQALTSAAVGPGGARDVMSRLARVVGGWAVLLDPRGTPVYVAPRGEGAAGAGAVTDTGPGTPSEGVEAVAESAGAVAADAEAGDDEKVVATARRAAALLRGRGRRSSAVDVDATTRTTAIPVGLGDGAVPVLVVGVPAGSDSAAPGLLTFAAALLTLHRERDRATTQIHAWGRSAALAVHLGLPLPPAPMSATSLADGARLRAVVLAAAPDDVLTRLERAALVSECTVLGLDDPGVQRTLVVAADPATEVLAALAGFTGGVSEATGPQALAAAVEAARQVSLRSRSGIVGTHEEPASVQQLLGPAFPAFAEGTLAPLRAAPGGRGLEDTLRTWLSLHGQTVAVAEAMGVHRHTVRERLRRVAALLGRDLDDPQVRAELWLALTP